MDDYVLRYHVEEQNRYTIAVTQPLQQNEPKRIMQQTPNVATSATLSAIHQPTTVQQVSFTFNKLSQQKLNKSLFAF